jgi:hypothetical protein
VFFNETINCERYVWVILGQVFSELTEEERLYGWFQQDSATAHIAHTCMQGFSRCLRGTKLSAVIFGQHVHLILILVIFFFWGCLMDKVHNHNPRTEELKENIHTEISNISREHLREVNCNLFHWCEECLCVEGQHFQHLL